MEGDTYVFRVSAEEMGKHSSVTLQRPNELGEMWPIDALHSE